MGVSFIIFIPHFSCSNHVICCSPKGFIPMVRGGQTDGKPPANGEASRGVGIQSRLVGDQRLLELLLASLVEEH